MPQIGPLEILVIFVVALLVFGPKEIPKMARQAAKAWREVQRFQANVRRDLDDVLHDDEEAEDAGRPPTLPPKALPAEQPPPDAASPSREASPPADTTP